MNSARDVGTLDPIANVYERHRAEIERLKKLNLGPARDTEYCKAIRSYVPRSRMIGADGVVRTRRLRNEEPMAVPKDSEHGRLLSAFADIRKEGVDARWNVLGVSLSDHIANLPWGEPGLFHWKADGSTNHEMQTGMQWTREWECVQDNVLLAAICGSEDKSEEILNSHGFRTIVHNYGDNEIYYIKLIFRGSDGAPLVWWDWIDNCISDNPIEPPPIS
jgi:hypothetical protein